MIVLTALIASILCAIVSEEIARARGRSAVGYGLAGFFLGPLGLIAALLTRPNEKVLAQWQLERGLAKQCPACREIIRSDASSCRYCQHRMTSDELIEQDVLIGEAADLAAKRRRRRAYVTIALVACIVLGILTLSYIIHARAVASDSSSSSNGFVEL
jgi:RNA polymerase subunit RPABC4/transcription elongation factor Spt4